MKKNEILYKMSNAGNKTKNLKRIYIMLTEQKSNEGRQNTIIEAGCSLFKQLFLHNI